MPSKTKVGLAEMLRGGTIMDVVDVAQAVRGCSRRWGTR